MISDLHVGTRLRRDLLRHPDAVRALAGALEGVDRLVLLGDTLELRDRPRPEVLEVAAPFLRAVGEAMRGGEVVLVPGNHDHGLAREALAGRSRRARRASLGLSERFAPTGPLARRIHALLGGELVLAYPGFDLAPGVWATHGHYADAHSSARSLETLLAAAGVLARPRLRSHGPRRPADYEAVLATTYALFEAIAQQRRLQAGADAGKRLVRAAEVRTGGRVGAGSPARRATARDGAGRRLGALPGEWRRPGVRPLTRVLEQLEVEARTVVFGHTHRVGPVAGDPPAWTTAAGTVLVNTGSWVAEAGPRPSSAGAPPTGAAAYLPGAVTFFQNSDLAGVDWPAAASSRSKWSSV